MGKRQHQKDKMYLTYTEWTTLYGGKRSGPEPKDKADFRRLPFDHCCVSLQPFEHPYCDKDGNVFELQDIIAFIKHFKVNPVTGQPMEAKSLIKLNFFKNSEGHYHCPVLYKPFTNNSHIVAVKNTGNVFSMEAIEQLNFKTKSLRDLITDEPFTRNDLITIQDSANVEKFNLTKFYHVKNKIRVVTEGIFKLSDPYGECFILYACITEEKAAKSDPNARLKTISMETRETLDQLNKDFKPCEPVIHGGITVQKSTDKFNAAHFSTGVVAAGFTSTVMPVVLEQESALLADDVVRYDRVKKKAYVRLVTNLGQLNLELHSDIIPKTCENFVKHCANGYYNGTKFHRSIKHFMIQGGDPTGKGTGGDSIWGGPFEDECKSILHHTGRGILSMANSGPNSNKSQFFITYRSCRHLDNKHTVFGRVVGGLDTLNAMELVNVDNQDRPIEDIIIERAIVFVDPYQEADEQLARDREAELKKKAEELASEHTKKKVEKPLTVYRQGIGKYLNLTTTKPESTVTSTQPPIKKKKEIPGYKFGAFNNW